MTRQESARLNGPKSKGPITPEGKAISSQNAVKHGLCAHTINPALLIPNVLLHNEPEERFQNHFAAMLEKYEPADISESSDVVTYCSYHWRWLRAMELETAAVSGKLAELKAEPNMSEAFRTQLAFAEAYEDSAFFANLPLYETRLERLCAKARRRLDAMLERREPKSPPKSMTKSGPEPYVQAAPQAIPTRTNEPVAIPPAPGKIPRNARCICGSNLKYKRCCGGPKSLPPQIPLAA